MHDYYQFIERYASKLSKLNALGLRRQAGEFHLVDLFPSAKSMKQFSTIDQVFGKNIDFDIREDSASVYIHFPFCENLCTYCHIYKESIFDKGELVNQFLLSLENEIKLYYKILNKKLFVRSLYFGGGTPSLISEQCLLKIWEVLNKYFNINEETYISYEFYPKENFNKFELIDKLVLLKSLGVKEIVLDLESTNPKALRAVGRGNSSLASWREIVKLVKRVGIERIKTAVIIGLPYDNLDTLKKTIFDIALADEVSTIALFLLEFRKNTPIYQDYQLNSRKYANEYENDKMQIMARKILRDLGFYEEPVHFFNRPEFRKQENSKSALIDVSQGYLLGFGPSAYGHLVLDGKAYKYINTSNIHKYLESVAVNELPISRWCQLTPEQQLLSKVINDLSGTGVVNLNKITENFNSSSQYLLEVFLAFAKLDLVNFVNDQFVVTELGKLRLEELLWYLYDRDYQEKQRRIEDAADGISNNYVTTVLREDEKKFRSFIDNNVCLNDNKLV